MAEKNEVSLDELITEETTKRLEEMNSPDYEFPAKITKTDVLWMVGSALASLALIVLCMTEVIS